MGFRHHLRVAAFAELFAHPTEPDLLLQGIAAFANLAIIIGSIMGYRRLAIRSNRDFARLVVAFVLTNGVLVGATALLAPSYLSHLAGMLHPHWPWQRS